MDLDEIMQGLRDQLAVDFDRDRLEVEIGLMLERVFAIELIVTIDLNNEPTTEDQS